jgi:hypothetical protein
LVVYDQIADSLRQRGFEEEEKWTRVLADKCREKLLAE